MRMNALSLLSLAILSGVRASTVFLKQTEYIGEDFFEQWQWETFDDPTHGRTNYIDMAAAKQQNLSFGAESRT